MGLFIAETDRRGARRFHRSSIGPTGDGVLHRAAAPGGGEAPIRVLIVDDHRLFADAIRVTVTEMGMSVLGIYATAASGLAGAREHRPDMVLLDLGLPDRSGLELGRDILEELPETKVVAVTALEDEKSVQDAFKAGFHGYLTKQTEAERFTQRAAEHRGRPDGVPATEDRPGSRSGRGMSSWRSN